MINNVDQIFLCMSFDGFKHSLILSIHPGVELLGHRVYKYLALVDISKQLFNTVSHIYIPTSNI